MARELEFVDSLSLGAPVSESLFEEFEFVQPDAVNKIDNKIPRKGKSLRPFLLMQEGTG